MGADDTRHLTKRLANLRPPRAEHDKRALHAIRSGVGHASRRATKMPCCASWYPQLPVWRCSSIRPTRQLQSRRCKKWNRQRAPWPYKSRFSMLATARRSV